MYAIIRTGGKQYKVQPGDRIRVEKLPAAVGDELVLKDVLLVGGDGSTAVGSEAEGAQVHAVVLKQDKWPKVVIFKKKRRQGYRRTRGHRQPFTELFIKTLSFKGKVVEAQPPQNVALEHSLVDEVSEVKTSQEKSETKARSVGVRRASASKRSAKSKTTTKKAVRSQKVAGAGSRAKKTVKPANKK